METRKKVREVIEVLESDCIDDPEDLLEWLATDGVQVLKEWLELRELPRQIGKVDFPIRYAIATIQAFINHHRHPDCFGIPELEKASKAWRDLSDWAIETFEGRDG